ncbi:hypothetical protein [Rhizobium sp. 60-20]|uniref:hypothetical protein n=1 Tax=Rhizobium sp. 60-20 TaxID=1895819 RepID=UPI00092B6454|nr:hypothetical protein [Rhizobium sp. 60-20]OJY66398.1 MAG: hypothetical protein BGP09_31195 [Rhizobium sp. 60-20]
MSRLEELIAALEKAEAPDRELDRLIHFHVVSPWLAEKCVDWVHAAFEEPNDFLWWDTERKAAGKEGYHDGWSSVTHSIDAAMTLANDILPKWRIRTEHGDNYSMVEFVRGYGARKEILGLATSERPDDHIALCICASALRAKLTQEEA